MINDSAISYFFLCNYVVAFAFFIWLHTYTVYTIYRNFQLIKFVYSVSKKILKCCNNWFRNYFNHLNQEIIKIERMFINTMVFKKQNLHPHINTIMLTNIRMWQCYKAFHPKLKGNVFQFINCYFVMKTLSHFIITIIIFLISVRKMTTNIWDYLLLPKQKLKRLDNKYKR